MRASSYGARARTQVPSASRSSGSASAGAPRARQTDACACWPTAITTGLRLAVARSRSSPAVASAASVSPTASRISVAAASTWMRFPVWRVSASERRAMAAAACTLPRASRSSASPGCGSSPSFDASVKCSSAESNLPSSRSRFPRTLAARPAAHCVRVREAHRAELVERLGPATVELLELCPSYLALAGEVAEIRLRGDPLRHRGGPLLRPSELVDRPAALDHTAVDDAFHHRRARARGDAEHRFVETGEPLVGVAGRQQEQALLVEGQRGVLLGSVPPSGPHALLGDARRTLEVSAARRLEGAGARSGKPPPSSRCRPPRRSARPERSTRHPRRRLPGRSSGCRARAPPRPPRAARRARAGSCRRAPGSRSSPASAPAGARSRRTGRSPRRRAGPRSPLRRTRRRRAAMRARRTPSGPPGASRHQYQASTGPRGASLL